MDDNPRLAIACEWLDKAVHWRPKVIEASARELLTKLNAVDPMRREPSDKAVDALIEALLGEPRHQPHPETTTKYRRALVAARAVMAGESEATEPSAITPGIFHSLTPEQQQRALNYRGPENHGDPEFRLDAALAPEPPADPPPEWTAEQREAVLTAIKGLFVGVQNSMDVLTVRRVVFDTEQKFLAAFAKPEPVWPPEDCKYPRHCSHNPVGACAHPGIGCSHAGERADVR